MGSGPIVDTKGDVLEPIEQLDIDDATERVRINGTLRDEATVPLETSRLGEHLRHLPSIHSPSSVRGFFEIQRGLIRERRISISNTGTCEHVKQ